ncbi:hypothetical protein LSM04_006314 [Trypanosoma melophagium]|uniref:uncharacterized protein n=1 Tax=Trypanosoma melophagium TaxID=715481 RepID=UPI00351A3137|nr:hypothetical protein LSM04_006314 [Trypanosoma melophagium]
MGIPQNPPKYRQKVSTTQRAPKPGSVGLAAVGLGSPRGRWLRSLFPLNFRLRRRRRQRGRGRKTASLATAAGAPKARRMIPVPLCGARPSPSPP